MKPKLKVGDIVRVKGKSYYGNHVHGMKGRIEMLNVGEVGLVLVALDEKIYGKIDALVYPHQLTKLSLVK